MDSPTAADWANHAAQQAKNHSEWLEGRVKKLEDKLEEVIKTLSEVINEVNGLTGSEPE